MLILLFWLLSTLWIYHFHCYSLSFLLLYLSFNFDSLHRHPDSPHFSHFNPDSKHSHAESPAFTFHSLHSYPYSPHYRHSVPQLPISAFIDNLLSLSNWQEFFLKKIVTLVQKWTPLVLLIHNPRHQIIVCITYDVISDTTKNYLPYSTLSKKSITCEEQINMSCRSVT